MSEVKDIHVRSTSIDKIDKIDNIDNDNYQKSCEYRFLLIDR